MIPLPLSETPTPPSKGQPVAADPSVEEDGAPFTLDLALSEEVASESAVPEEKGLRLEIAADPAASDEGAAKPDVSNDAQLLGGDAKLSLADSPEPESPKTQSASPTSEAAEVGQGLLGKAVRDDAKAAPPETAPLTAGNVRAATPPTPKTAETEVAVESSRSNSKPVPSQNTTVAQSVIEGRIPPDEVQKMTRPETERFTLKEPREVPQTSPDQSKTKAAEPVPLLGDYKRSPTRTVDMTEEVPRKYEQELIVRRHASDEGLIKDTKRRFTAVQQGPNLAPNVGPNQTLNMIEVAKVSAEPELLLQSIGSDRSMPATQVGTTTPTHYTAPETGRQVAQQIAIAITNQTGGPTEITLNPEELGRVRMMMMANEGAVVVNLTAERGETQELLRRHIDLLGQELRALGYTSIDFSFDGQNSQGQQLDLFESDGLAVNEWETVPEQESGQIAYVTTGVDIRI